MATLKEMLTKLGQPVPELPEFSSEDLTYFLMIAMIPQKDKDAHIETLTNLLLAFAFKIEALEEELFATKWNR